MALRYNLSSNKDPIGKPGNNTNLSQNELLNLNKQRYLKMKLRNNLMNIDLSNKKIVSIDKFDIECK